MAFQAQKSTAGAGNPHLSGHVGVTLLQLSHSCLLGLAPPETRCYTCRAFHVCQTVLLREGSSGWIPTQWCCPTVTVCHGSTTSLQDFYW